MRPGSKGELRSGVSQASGEKAALGSLHLAALELSAVLCPPAGAGVEAGGSPQAEYARQQDKIAAAQGVCCIGVSTDLLGHWVT